MLGPGPALFRTFLSVMVNRVRVLAWSSCDFCALSEIMSLPLRVSSFPSGFLNPSGVVSIAKDGSSCLVLGMKKPAISGLRVLLILSC